MYRHTGFGLHVTVVTGPIGYPAAVLMRSVEDDGTWSAHLRAGHYWCPQRRKQRKSRLECGSQPVKRLRDFRNSARPGSEWNMPDQFGR